MRPVQAEGAPRAIGPYSQAVEHAGLVYCSGQIALDAETGQLDAGSVADETRCVLRNLAAVLGASGSSLRSVVRTTVYLRDMADFGEMNGVYAEAFGEHRPARATVAVSGLPRGARVEIDCIAVVETAGR